MNYFVALALLRRLRDGSELDSVLAVNYLTFISDHGVRLYLDHLQKYREYNLEIATFLDSAKDLALADVLAVFSKTDVTVQVRTIKRAWRDWSYDFKSHLGTADITNVKDATEAVDHFIGTLSVMRDGLVKAIASSDDSEKRSFIGMMAPLPTEP